MNLNKKIELFPLFFIAFSILTGCSITNIQGPDALALTQSGQYKEAKAEFRRLHSPQSRDKLLYYLELAMVNHLEKNYIVSNELLEQANDIIDAEFTISISDQSLGLMTGPSYRTFKSKLFHKPLLHTLKALNYNELANIHIHKSIEYKDAALIEMRRLDIYLENLKSDTGGYVLKPQSNSDVDKFFQILKPIFSSKPIYTQIEYKDDAFAHYLSGLLFESSGDWDSARIQYERAFEAFNNGFAEQYRLSDEPTNQAASDLLYSIQKTGGFANLQEQLKKIVANKARSSDSLVTIIQSIGFAPERKSFNLYLKADEDAKALVLTPFFIGSKAERQAQYHWFQMLYADTSLFDMIQNYITGDIDDVVLGSVTKRIPLGTTLWEKAEESGLISALRFGSRISVTYLEPPTNIFKHSELWVNDQLESTLPVFHSVSLLTIQDAIRNSQSEMLMAIVRELGKSYTAHKAIQSTGLDENALFNDISKLTTSFVNAVTASADTRQWKTLPDHIRLVRVPIDGEITKLEVKSFLADGRVITQPVQFNQNSSGIVHLRTFSVVSQTQKIKVNRL